MNRWNHCLCGTPLCSYLKYLTIACSLNLSLFLAASFVKPLFNDSAAIIQSIPLSSVWFPLRKLFLGHRHLHWWIINKCRASICKKARAPILKPDFWHQSGPLHQPCGEAKCGVYACRHAFLSLGLGPSGKTPQRWWCVTKTWRSIGGSPVNRSRQVFKTEKNQKDGVE